MWKREDEPRTSTATPPGAPAPAVTPVVHSANPSPSPSPSAEGSRDRAVLGASLSVRGEVAGAEDLLVQGKIEGKIDLADNSVTIGRSGKVAADIFAKSVMVEGEIKGNLFATEQILIRKSGSVHGNLTAPRIVLEDGCKFKGSVDMESPSPQRGAVRPTPPHTPERAERSDRTERADRDRPASAISSGAANAAMPASR